MSKTSLTKGFVLLCLLLIILSCNSKTVPQKQKALTLLKETGIAVREPLRLSFNIIVDEDKLTPDSQVVKEHRVCHVDAEKPNKLFVSNKIDTHAFFYFYDGEYFTYYSKDENNYVKLGAPETTAAMIDSMHYGFGFNFPAGDFFYPSFGTDFEAFFDVIDIEGHENVDGEACTKVYAKNDNIDAAVWISDKTQFPAKLEIVYKKKNNIKYQALFTKWDTNPPFKDAVFAFEVPEDASLINIMTLE